MFLPKPVIIKTLYRYPNDRITLARKEIPDCAPHFCGVSVRQAIMKQHNRRQVLILDGQGGGIGAQLVRLLNPILPPDCGLLCVGTNVLATSAMLKAGAPQGATGENAVLYHAARSELILGPIGILLANGLLGEVSPAMAAAVSGSDAKKILIPSTSCGVMVTGTEHRKLEDHLHQAVELVRRELAL